MLKTSWHRTTTMETMTTGKTWLSPIPSGRIPICSTVYHFLYSWIQKKMCSLKQYHNKHSPLCIPLHDHYKIWGVKTFCVFILQILTQQVDFISLVVELILYFIQSINHLFILMIFVYFTFNNNFINLIKFKEFIN